MRGQDDVTKEIEEFQKQSRAKGHNCGLGLEISDDDYSKTRAKSDREQEIKQQINQDRRDSLQARNESRKDGIINNGREINFSNREEVVSEINRLKREGSREEIKEFNERLSRSHKTLIKPGVQITPIETSLNGPEIQSILALLSTFMFGWTIILNFVSIWLAIKSLRSKNKKIPWLIYICSWMAILISLFYLSTLVMSIIAIFLTLQGDIGGM